MEQLTAQQAKMVIEYFAAQAAEDVPLTTDWKIWDKHLWMTRMQASIAVERQITAFDWDTLVNAEMDLQSFDRDPDAYMFQRDAEGTKAQMHNHLEEQVSWWIDNAYRTSGA
jgi:hypothetical protein